MKSHIDTILDVMKRGVGVLFRPQKTWDAIAEEPGGMKEAFFPYAVLLGFIPAVMVGGFGVSSIGWYVEGLLIAWLAGGVLALLAVLFGARRNWVLACRVVIYAGTPFYMSSLFGVIPIFGLLLSVIAIPWGLILLYQGIGRVLEVHGARQLLLTLSTLMVFGAISYGPMGKVWASKSQAALATADAPHAELRSLDPTIVQTRIVTGQASDEDIQKAADFQLQDMISHGQMAPAEAAAKRAEFIRELQKMNAEAKATAVSK